MFERFSQKIRDIELDKESKITIGLVVVVVVITIIIAVA